MTTTNGSLPRSNRLPALRRFAVAITVLNILGHFYLGFEQSWAQPLVALATAYSIELLLELVSARAERRQPHFAGGFRQLVDFLLPAHITALAVAMLLYANDRLGPIAFATAVAVGSKAIVRVPVGGGSRHFLNPSNTGIALTLLLFPWVGIAPPYHFTENLTGIGDLFLPLVIVISGTFLNTRFTGKMPLIVAWLGGFVIQAVLRSLFFGTPVAAALLPMTGMAFLLFTFYMMTDPGTTPTSPPAQFAFGSAVAAAYASLMILHVVFGLFFALLLVCSVRGFGLAVLARSRAAVPSRPESLAPSRVALPEPAALEVAER
jgi:enediyne biosynthesis protein E5